MQALDRLGWAAGFGVACHGIRIGLRASEPSALAPYLERLPPGWRPERAPAVERVYSIRAGAPRAGGVRRFELVYGDAERLARTLRREEALEAFDSDVRLFVAERARDRVFVHAGAVGWRGRAILLPGRSHSGKSTLVAELLRAGATYYSDEYAVLDRGGRVHPFPVPLSLRNGGDRPSRVRIEDAGRAPLPIGLVVSTRYRRGAAWRPRRLTPGQAVLSLLDHTVPARRRPRTVLAVLALATRRALAVRTGRGEAAEAARRILVLSEAT